MGFTLLESHLSTIALQHLTTLFPVPFQCLLFFPSSSLCCTLNPLLPRCPLSLYPVLAKQLSRVHIRQLDPATSNFAMTVSVHTHTEAQSTSPLPHNFMFTPREEREPTESRREERRSWPVKPTVFM